MIKPAKTFSHIDAQTGNPAMVDVSHKQPGKRTATAQSIVNLGNDILKHFSGNDIETKKGPVFQTAIIAGTMAAKKTAGLIPLCHPLAIEDCKITIRVDDAQQLIIECTVTVTAKTGVEMEALTGACLAALTVYDMCKSLSQDITIVETKLIKKTGGKHDLDRKRT